MSAELPRECEWSRLFLNSGSCGMKKMASRAVQLIKTTGKHQLLQILNYFNKGKHLAFCTCVKIAITIIIAAKSKPCMLQNQSLWGLRSRERRGQSCMHPQHNAASRRQPCHIQAQPHSYLFPQDEIKVLSLANLPRLRHGLAPEDPASRNSPSMPG